MFPELPFLDQIDAATRYEEAGIGPAEVSVAEVYDDLACF
jgi:hypothetical protein